MLLVASSDDGIFCDNYANPYIENVTLVVISYENYETRLRPKASFIIFI